MVKTIIIIVKSSYHQTVERDVHHYSMRRITLTKAKVITKYRTISEIHSNRTNSKALFNKCLQEIRMRSSGLQVMMEIPVVCLYILKINLRMQ